MLRRSLYIHPMSRSRVHLAGSWVQLNVSVVVADAVGEVDVSIKYLHTHKVCMLTIRSTTSSVEGKAH